jgi:hypothetical protein
MFNSYPNDLSEKTDTIELSYINWACACANWRPTKLNGLQIEDSITDESCIFIEAGPSTYQVSEEIYCCSNRVRLIGSFYEDEGISRDYISPTDQKPDLARVFQYHTFEYIKPVQYYQSSGDSIWLEEFQH